MARGIGKTDLPTSKAGEAMGESSVVMVKMPSNLRSGKGSATSAEMRARTLRFALASNQTVFIWRGRKDLVLPSRTSATPYSSPKVT